MNLKKNKRFNYILLTIVATMVITCLCYALDDKRIMRRIDKLIQQLTLEEKISMIHGNTLFSTAPVERLGIGSLIMSDGPHGVRPEQSKEYFGSAGHTDDASTYLPTTTALTSTWNPELSYKFGNVLGSEARARGKDIILGPGINIIRTPLCGRNFEYMSEDPYLISQMVVPYIKGVQDQDVSACVKHFAMNNQEYNRNDTDVYVSQRAMNEIYLPGFKVAVQQGKVLTVMGAYNLFRGQHCCQNDYLLNKILKNDWGFAGAVISDWGGAYDTNDAALNGLDIEMGTKNPVTGKRNNFDNYWLANPFLEKIKQGSIAQSVLDDKVRRVLHVMYNIKMFDKNRKKGTFNTPEHQKVALEIAQQAIVLLKNDNSILPIPKTINSIAIIGDNATRKHSLGGFSSEIKALYEITPLEGMQKKVDGKIKLNFAQGYSKEKDSSSQELIAQAVEAAKNSDMAVIFGGLNHDYDSECHDRQDMKLPYAQDELIKAVIAANPKTVVVLVSGSPVEVYKWIDSVPAVLQGWYAGMEAGTAMADVLFGDVNPSGKLPFTFPVKLEDSPAHIYGDYPGENNIVHYKEDILVGYRYFDTKKVKPQFCFGHGLSYTQFKYSNMQITPNKASADQKITVSAEIENTGKIGGMETVQLYINDPQCSVPKAAKELKGFSKIFLNSGEKKIVTFEIDAEKLSFYDNAKEKWIAEPGEFKILLASSSADIRLQGTFKLLN